MLEKLSQNRQNTQKFWQKVRNFLLDIVQNREYNKKGVFFGKSLILLERMVKNMIVKDYVKDLKEEFSGYNAAKFGKDVLAGITCAAVALPLALAFGVGSGASAASGLVTAVISGIVIGLLSGGFYQISGPTGAMTAILVSLVAQYGLKGVFIASFMSGVILLLCGLLKLGGLVSFIPSPVITGFTSGIAIIIALGQVNNLTGLTSEGLTTIEKLVSYFRLEQNPNYTGLIIGAAVILFMFIYPKKLTKYCPASLAAIIIATAVNMIVKFDVPVVGEIPKSIFLADRLTFADFDPSTMANLSVSALSIAALGLIESLLCGASAGRMTGKKLNADQELVAQGVGNMLIPFFGGVPATAAIARTSVAIKSGCVTRLTSVIHAVVLLLSMFVLGGVMSQIPLSALAGVLIVTAWRMNEWEAIKSIFGKKIKTAMSQFLITMAATVVFDLTVAIVIGVVFSIIMFVVKVSDMQVCVSDVDADKLGDDVAHPEALEKTKVAYITGPLYFGTANKLEEKLEDVKGSEIIIFSMRGVPLADISGVSSLLEICRKHTAKGSKIYFSCVQPPVKEMFGRCGLTEEYSDELFYWSTDRALSAISAMAEV